MKIVFFFDAGNKPMTQNEILNRNEQVQTENALFFARNPGGYAKNYIESETFGSDMSMFNQSRTSADVSVASSIFSGASINPVSLLYMIPATETDGPSPTGHTNLANAGAGFLIGGPVGAVVGALANTVGNVVSHVVDGVSNFFSNIFGW